MNKVNLQNKTRTLIGSVEKYWVENECIGLSKTLFHRISIPIMSNSRLSNEFQFVETQIIIESLNLNLVNPEELDNLHISSQKYKDMKASIYIGGAHNVCEVLSLHFTKRNGDKYQVVGEVAIDFESEGVAQNEVFSFQTCVDNYRMYFSNEIQERLDKLNSKVKVISTFDGGFMNKDYSYNSLGRDFMVELASTETEISIVLYERTEEQGYGYCFARGLFTDLDKLAGIIDLWVDKQEDIAIIKKRFDELELYVDFDIRNANPDIDKAWTKVKNMFFNNTSFWKNSEWQEHYIEMLNEAKRHKAFENYYPFTSHYWLRFSIDKEIRKIWIMSIYIVPSMYRGKRIDSLGKFYVSYNETPTGGRFFETAKEALDFYAEILKEIKLYKWRLK